MSEYTEPLSGPERLKLIDEYVACFVDEGHAVLTMDGFEDAILGVVERFGMEPVVAYDRKKVLRIMIDRDGMTEEEAEEFYYHNQLGAWMGSGTPAFITRVEDMS